MLDLEAVREDPSMRRGWAVGAVGVLVVATGVSTWWHVGDLSEVEPGGNTAVVLFRAPQIGEGTERLLDCTATAVAAGSLLVLIHVTSCEVVPRRSWRVALPLVLMAGFAALHGVLRQPVSPATSARPS